MSPKATPTTPAKDSDDESNYSSLTARGNLVAPPVLEAPPLSTLPSHRDPRRFPRWVIQSALLRQNHRGRKAASVARKSEGARSVGWAAASARWKAVRNAAREAAIHLPPAPPRPFQIFNNLYGRHSTMTAVNPSRSGVSPSSSPRLPSPPPIPEVQYGPKSPGISDLNNELSLDALSKPDEGAKRRIRPGTKAADMAVGPPLIPLSQLDSPFQLQEHLKALYSSVTHTAESTHTIPITKESALKLATPPQINDTEMVDKQLWLYELCRFLTMKANIVSIFLMNDNPPCSSQTCPEMRASEWQYLCAVHEPPKSCCAIDYCNHTLDWAANVLTSPKHFPSRLALGGEGGNAIQSMRQLTNIFRRVYRIFAHAWFQHRDVFWSVEATYGLYMLFKTICDEYHLIPEDSYTIPPEAEGGPAQHETPTNDDTSTNFQILRKEPAAPQEMTPLAGIEAPTTTTVTTGATTRRHKHTPSTGIHVTPIAEGQEEEDEPQPTKSVTEVFPTPAKNDIAGSPPKSVSPQAASLPKLDIAATVPKYEPRIPEDPTPRADVEDADPLAAAGEESPPKTDSTVPSIEHTPHTPIDKKKDDGEEAQFSSPSGGSVRTSSNNFLDAILGHIHDLGDQGTGTTPEEKLVGEEEPKTNFESLEEKTLEVQKDDDDDKANVKDEIETKIE